MSNEATIEKTATNQDVKGADKAKSSADVRKQAIAEATAYSAKVLAILREGAELRPIALDVLAEELGKSANKQGRPTESAYLAFISAIAHRGNMDYARRADLCRKANAAGRAEHPLHKDVAVQKAKASASEGSASFRIQAPAKLDVALGD